MVNSVLWLSKKKVMTFPEKRIHYEANGRGNWDGCSWATYNSVIMECQYSWDASQNVDNYSLKSLESKLGLK